MNRVNRLAILFALRRESMFFLRTMTQARRRKHTPCPVWTGEVDGVSLRVLETGIGKEKTRRALDWLHQPSPTDSLRPDLVVSAGFGGALDPALRVGEVVQAGQVVDEQGNAWTTQVAFSEQPALRFLTSTRMIASAAEKARLLMEHAAPVVDMESAEAARFCAELDLPLVCLRGISDDAVTELSPWLIPLLSGGRVAAGRLIWTVCRRPYLVPQLWRLGNNTRQAGAALALALRRFLQNLAAN